jgi:hypothetical protein
MQLFNNSMLALGVTFGKCALQGASQIIQLVLGNRILTILSLL